MYNILSKVLLNPVPLDYIASVSYYNTLVPL